MHLSIYQQVKVYTKAASDLLRIHVGVEGG